MKQTILIPQDFETGATKSLVDAGLDVVTVDKLTDQIMLDHADTLVGAVVHLEKIDPAVFKQLPHLKILARTGVGYENVDDKSAAENGIYVTITPKANFRTVTEAILGAMLMLSRNTLQRMELMKDGDWKAGRKKTGYSLFGQTLGIIGYGRIGQELAKCAHALGMNILYNNGRHHKQSDIGQSVSLEELLRQSDYISLNVPVTDETVNMINAHTLSLMKPTAALINYGRGKLIDTDALVTALSTGKLRCAALDSFDPEPLPMDSPLRKLDNVMLTPHLGGATIDAMIRGCRDAASEIIRVAQGKKPLWAVNQPKE